jgi:DNA-binding GntR family transcriptional regulator
MRTEDHCRRCLDLLGEDFRHVHLWLDEFSGTPQYGTRHRHVRHHARGIEEVRQRWGDRAREAAELHVEHDLAGEAWQKGRDPMPRDAEEWRMMGLW